MTTMTMTANHRGSFAPHSIILLAIVIALAAVSMHAIARHGTAAIAASQCADRPELRMFNPENGRIAFICMTERGWGVSIIARDGGPVTSFVKEKMRTLEQVIRYMRNTGYEPIQ
jgi:hypothetical protein